MKKQNNSAKKQKIQQCSRRHKGETSVNFKPKNILAKIKSQWMSLIAGWTGQREELENVKIKPQKLSKMNDKKKNEKKKKRFLPCGSVSL